jgi:hypothetical protein
VSLNFAPAVRSEAKARVALLGPTGAGKTWTALEWANALGERIGVIDTENNSASLYSDVYSFQSAPWPPPYDATKLAAAIKHAAKQFDVLLLDSLTHFWAGEGGVLDVVDRNTRGGNSYVAWKSGTPIWRGLLDALIFAPCHVIVTMRSKMDHAIVEGDDGKKKVEKVGMAPQARNDVEYEFTVVGELDQQHRLTITKSRCAALADQVAAPHQAGQLALTLRDWLGSAAAQPASAPPSGAPVEPAGPPNTDPPTDPQTRKAMALFSEHGLAAKADRLAYTSNVIGRTVGSWADVTKREAAKVIDSLESRAVPA